MTDQTNSHRHGSHDEGRDRLFGVLVTYRRPTELSASLRHLAGQTRGLDGFLVVDNSPDGETQAVVSAYRTQGMPVEYVAAPENLGPAGGIALGMKRVLKFADDEDWIVLFDDDNPCFTPSLLEDLYAFATMMRGKDPRTSAVGLVGARFDWKRGRVLRVPDDELDGPIHVDYIGGGQFPFYLVAAIRAVGPFCADLFWGQDDLEYGLRLKKAGYSMYAHGDAWLDRRASADTLGVGVRPSLRVSDPTWRRYYALRNAVYILRSFGHELTALRVTVVRGFAKPLVNLVVTPRLAGRNLALNWRACWDGWRNRMGRTLEPDVEHSVERLRRRGLL